MHTDKHRLKTDFKDELREEYDLSKLRNRVCGKYVERYRQGKKLILPESSSNEGAEQLGEFGRIYGKASD